MDISDDAAGERKRLQLYVYLTEAPVYFTIMRVFSSSLLADLSAAEISNALKPLETEGRIPLGESSVEQVQTRLAKLRHWGNLAVGRRETNARSIAEFAHGSIRYQVSKLAVRIHRDAEELLSIAEGAREVSREMFPAIRRGLEVIKNTGIKIIEAERAGGSSNSLERTSLRATLAEQVTTLFLQHGQLSETVRDFYAHVGQTVARHDLNPEEIAGFRGFLVEYIQLVGEDVLRHTPPIVARLNELAPLLSDILKLLESTTNLGSAVERARGRTAIDWQGLSAWFIDQQGRPSQVAALREATTRAIGSLLSNVKRATSSSGIAPSRRGEMLRMAVRFDSADLRTAHLLYTQVFGLSSARHWVAGPNADETLPTKPWAEGTLTPVSVSTSSRGERARGRTARITENPLGDRAAQAQAELQARRREAVFAELRAAASHISEVRLSRNALDTLYDLIHRAMSRRETCDGECVYTHTPSRLRVLIRPEQGACCRIHAAHGTLTLHGVSLVVEVRPAKISHARANDRI